MPLNTPRSAFSKLKLPSSGVSPGSLRSHGPNPPSTWISPGGTPLVSVASNGHESVEPRLVHPQVMDRPDFRRLVRLARDDDQARVVGVDAVEHHAAVLQRILPLLFRRRLGRVVGRIGRVRGAFRFFLLHAHLLRRDADVEAVQLHVVDVFPPQTAAGWRRRETTSR